MVVQRAIKELRLSRQGVVWDIIHYYFFYRVSSIVVRFKAFKGHKTSRNELIILLGPFSNNLSEEAKPLQN